MNTLIRRSLTGALAVGALLAAAPLAVAAETAAPANCFDRAAPIPVEEQRLTLPVPQEILDRSGFDQRGPRFEKSLCRTRSLRVAKVLAQTQSRQLWKAAVDRVQGRGPAGGDLARSDDRPLYWARLQLTRALHQWQPAFTLSPTDRKALLDAVETGSRGQDSIDLPAGNRVKRVVLTGFDPFQLDGDIRRTNPSGATALALDGTYIDTPSGRARVETAVFPVLWTPFEAGVVEQTLLPHFKPGRKQVDLFTTVSQGRVGQFDIERYNGRWHTGADNNRENRAAGIPIPAGVPTVTPQPEFVPTTLPYKEIVAAKTGPFTVLDRTAVTEIPAGQTQPVNSPNGPTPGSVARAGGGGSYLSNEIAYRATLLRDAVKAKVPGGHVHTPILFFDPANPDKVSDPVLEKNRADIVAQAKAILAVAVGTL
ncbi:pyroglutamyl peptidase [Crossiella cryophila]|uniref:Pyrrolidone-carboxylate peptidase n=1 Tax=Crossiella cryophila TaxID=43355 RepID=A0A7W7CJR4_9PSEU|nr:pyroglutamyl peptidase [Crossiella cryophila]MBB4680734.1 pyrrolidone-carboxylate peptidase [Crossiella cryophila]